MSLIYDYYSFHVIKGLLPSWQQAIAPNTEQPDWFSIGSHAEEVADGATPFPTRVYHFFFFFFLFFLFFTKSHVGELENEKRKIPVLVKRTWLVSYKNRTKSLSLNYQCLPTASICSSW